MNKTKLRGTGVLVKPAGSQFWHCQYYDHGKPIRRSTKETDERKAQKFLDRKLAEITLNLPRETGKVTYGELRTAYLEDYRVNKRKSLRFDKQKQPTLDKVNRLDSFFTGFQAADIDARTIRRFAKQQQDAGLSNGSINRSISALRRMFHLAHQDERLTRLPYFPMLKEAMPRQGFFEKEEFAALVRELPDYLELPVTLGYYSGARLGEILSLTWKQVDFLRRVIHLTKTKNGEPRDLPFVAALERLLVARHALRRDCPYVCFRVVEDDRVKIAGFRRAWWSACCRAGSGELREATTSLRRKHKTTEYAGKIFHDLRRTAVRNMTDAGIAREIAMRISGHETEAMFTRYNILSSKNLSDAAQKLDRYHEATPDRVRTVSVDTESEPTKPVIQ